MSFGRDLYRRTYKPIIGFFAPDFSRRMERVFDELTRSDEAFGKNIDEAYESLKATSALIERLEGELDDKMEDLEKLKDKYERYSNLADVEKEKARALIDQLEEGKGAERWIAFGINIAAGLIIFVIGVLVGPWLTELMGVSR